MQVFKRIPEDLDSFQGDLMIAVVGSDERPLRSANAWLDWRLFGTMSSLISKGLFKGNLGEKCLIPTYGKFNFDRLVLLGGGALFEEALYPTSLQGEEHWKAIGRAIDETARSLKVEAFGLSLPRYDLIDLENASLKALSSSVTGQASFFMSRAPNYVATLNLG
jgi:hypothetical protein